MKKFVSLLLLAVLLSVVFTAFACSSEVRSVEEKSEILVDEGIKAFIGDPIYCKITLEDLAKAREEAKSRLVVSLK